MSVVKCWFSILQAFIVNKSSVASGNFLFNARARASASPLWILKSLHNFSTGSFFVMPITFILSFTIKEKLIVRQTCLYPYILTLPFLELLFEYLQKQE